MDKDKDTIGIDERGNTQDFFIESCSFFTKKKITGTETFFFPIKIIFTSAATKNCLM